MRSVHWFALLFCVGLLLLGSHTLIVGPADTALAEETAETSMAAPPCVVPALQLQPAQAQDAAERENPTVRLRDEAAICVAASCDTAPVTDRNGNPLARAVYRRTVWQAFPPEEHPG